MNWILFYAPEALGSIESRLRLDFSPPVTDIDMAIYNDKVYGMQNHVEFEIVKNVG